MRKHGVSFLEAATVFGDPLAITAPDRDHDVDEPREITFGLTEQGYLAVVAHVEQGNRMRIISARRATTQEIRLYEQS
ncbi:MAG: BrnT family toxin [Spirochaetota bacterium]